MEEKKQIEQEQQLEEANGGRPPTKITHYPDGKGNVHGTFWKKPH